MENKRLDSINIKKLICKNDNLEAEIEFNIVHKNSFFVMDRKLTLKSVILKYKNDKVEFSIMNFGGVEMLGFNLRRKHIADIIDLLKDLEKEHKEVSEIIQVLNNETIENQRKTIVCIMGKSGSGKSSAMINLCSKNNNYHMVQSFTTREERIDDPNDKLTHIFVDEELYKENLLDGKVLAVYNSPQQYISWATDKCFKNNKINLYAIDYQSYLKFKERKEYNVIGIYLDIEEEERQRRLNKREKGKVYDEENHLKRFSSSSYSDSKTNDCFNISVTNADIDDVAFLIDEIVKREIKK